MIDSMNHALGKIKSFLSAFTKITALTIVLVFAMIFGIALIDRQARAQEIVKAQEKIKEEDQLINGMKFVRNSNGLCFGLTYLSDGSAIRHVISLQCAEIPSDRIREIQKH